MPLPRSARRAISAVTLFLAVANAQTCYYPDGKTTSDDVPCPSNGTAAAACCPSTSVCLDNGLCYGAGLVSRASCTDATWGSAACAGYCKTVSTSGSVAVTPCSGGEDSNTFACGANTTDCQTDSDTFVMSGGSGLSLRADQVAVVLSSVLSATPSATGSGSQVTVTAYVTASPAASTEGLYTGGQMVGLGCGLGAPLLLALLASLFFLRRERQKHARPKLMYKLPDDLKDEFTYRPPRSAGQSVSPYTPRPPSTAGGTSYSPSRRTSFRTIGSQKPGHMQSFLERYETMKQKGQVHEKQRHELDSDATKDIPRHELGEGRVSR